MLFVFVFVGTVGALTLVSPVEFHSPKVPGML